MPPAGPTTAEAVIAAAVAATEMWLARQMASVTASITNVTDIATVSKSGPTINNNGARGARKPLVKVRAPHHLLKSASSSSTSRRSSAPPLTRHHLQVRIHFSFLWII